MSEFQKVDKNEEKKQTAPEAGTVRRELSDVNGPQGGMLPASVSQKIQAKRGSGTRLTPEQNKKYSGEFGRDMSDVRIHNDPESNALSQALNARAFTIGADVFLSKGIDPGRSKRDQKTLKHELTHVAQQNGQAGSGPLRLGAAHTTQEHEAEASAEGRGGVNTSASDTVQRGFWMDTLKGLSGVGHMLLKQFGLEDAFNDFMSGSDKVDAVEKKMKEDADQTNWTRYNELKKDYQASAKRVDTAEKEYKTAAKQYEKEQDEQIKAEKLAQKSGAHWRAKIVKADDVNAAKANYETVYEGHEKIRTERLALLQKYDETITQEDVDKKDSNKGKLMISVVLSSLAGGVSTVLSRDDPAAGGDAKKLAAAREEKQKKARSQVNNWFASKNKGNRAKVKTNDYKTVAMDRITDKKEAKEIKAPEEQYKDVIWSVYEDIKGEEWLKDVKIEKNDLWARVQTTADWRDPGGLKSQFADWMAGRLSENIINSDADASAFVQHFTKKIKAENELAAAPGFVRAAGMKKEKEDAERAEGEAQDKLNAFDSKATAEGDAGTVDVTVGAETRHLNRTTAREAVTAAEEDKNRAEAALAAAATDAERAAAQTELDNKTAIYDRAVEFRDALEEMIRDWEALIGGKTREVLEQEHNAALAAKETKEQTYANEGQAVYDAAIGSNAALANYIDDAHEDSIARAEAGMAAHRVNVHALVTPANIVKMLPVEQFDRLKGLVRNTVLSVVKDMKSDQVNADAASTANRAANFINDQNLIAEGIYEKTKERAKILPLYRGEGAPLADDVLRTKLLAGIKKTAEMASFWEKVKSASSGAANTAMDREKALEFVKEGTKAYTEVLENIRKGETAEGGPKYPRGADEALFNSIRGKAYALLPQELKTYFVAEDNEKFTNLFGGGDLLAYKNNIVAMTNEGVPIAVDKEAAELSEKIKAKEDWTNRAAQEKEANQRDKTESKNRQITDIIQGTFDAVKNDDDLKDSYTSWLRFQNMVKKELMDLIEDGLEQNMTNDNIVAALMEVLKEKQAKTGKDKSK